MGLTKQFHFSFFKVFLFPPFLSKICITYTHARDDGWWSSPPLFWEIMAFMRNKTSPSEGGTTTELAQMANKLEKIR